MAPTSEQSIEHLESELPELFSEAVREAHKRAVESGARVLIEKDGALYEIVDGSPPKFIENAKPGTPMKKGRKLIIP